MEVETMRTITVVLAVLALACSDGGPNTAGAEAGRAGEAGASGGDGVSPGGGGGVGGIGASDASLADAADGIDASIDASTALDASMDSGADAGEDVPDQDAAPHTLAGYGTCREDVDCYGEERCVWWPAPRPCEDDDDCPVGVCRATSAIGDVASRTCQIEPCTVTGSSGSVELYSCAGNIPGPPVCARPCSDASDCERPEGEHTADVVCDVAEGACRLECGEQFLGPPRTCPAGMNCTFGICTAG